MLNKLFDPSTPSMRKGRDGEKNGEGGNGGKNEKKITTEKVATNVVAA